MTELLEQLKLQLRHEREQKIMIIHHFTEYLGNEPPVGGEDKFFRIHQLMQKAFNNELEVLSPEEILGKSEDNEST